MPFDLDFRDTVGLPDWAYVVQQRPPYEVAVEVAQYRHLLPPGMGDDNGWRDRMLREVRRVVGEKRDELLRDGQVILPPHLEQYRTVPVFSFGSEMLVAQAVGVVLSMRPYLHDSGAHLAFSPTYVLDLAVSHGYKP